MMSQILYSTPLKFNSRRK